LGISLAKQFIILLADCCGLKFVEWKKQGTSGTLIKVLTIFQGPDYPIEVFVLHAVIE
jgi:hypothetical protein